MSRKAATEDKPKGRGGKREGAGRKSRHGVAAEESSIRMIPAGWALCDAQRGDLSRGDYIFGLLLKEDLK